MPSHEFLPISRQVEQSHYEYQQAVQPDLPALPRSESGSQHIGAIKSDIRLDFLLVVQQNGFDGSDAQDTGVDHIEEGQQQKKTEFLFQNPCASFPPDKKGVQQEGSHQPLINKTQREAVIQQEAAPKIENDKAGEKPSWRKHQSLIGRNDISDPDTGTTVQLGLQPLRAGIVHHPDGFGQGIDAEILLPDIFEFSGLL